MSPESMTPDQIEAQLAEGYARAADLRRRSQVVQSRLEPLLRERARRLDLGVAEWPWKEGSGWSKKDRAS